MKYLLGNKKLN